MLSAIKSLSGHHKNGIPGKQIGAKYPSPADSNLGAATVLQICKVFLSKCSIFKDLLIFTVNFFQGVLIIEFARIFITKSHIFHLINMIKWKEFQHEHQNSQAFFLIWSNLHFACVEMIKIFRCFLWWIPSKGVFNKDNKILQCVLIKVMKFQVVVVNDIKISRSFYQDTEYVDDSISAVLLHKILKFHSILVKMIKFAEIIPRWSKAQIYAVKCRDLFLLFRW